ncbi:MAG: hypothetical protein QNJ27_03840 [Simkaniaceae bacterium]|nr:hypothetical protein [Simkaniaceae bacterium]
MAAELFGLRIYITEGKQLEILYYLVGRSEDQDAIAKIGSSFILLSDQDTIFPNEKFHSLYSTLIRDVINRKKRLKPFIRETIGQAMFEKLRGEF